MENNKIPSWRLELKSSRNKEGKSSRSRWIHLATTTLNYEPRLRTVVFRGWKNEDSMLIYTDERSDKIKELRQNNNVEILWLFLKGKSQFRFKGKAYELADNQHYWNNLTTQSKYTWYWPSPGNKLNKSIPSIKESDLIKPRNFLVLEIKVYSVDFLKLEKPIHRRWKWDIQDNWTKIEVNP